MAIIEKKPRKKVFLNVNVFVAIITIHVVFTLNLLITKYLLRSHIKKNAICLWIYFVVIIIFAPIVMLHFDFLK